MSELKNSEKPEVYALRQENGSWRISRRDFLKAAGLGTAALGAGLCSGCSGSKSLNKICQNVPSAKGPIIDLFSSADGKQLVTVDHGVPGTAYPKNKEFSFAIHVWNFEKHYLGTTFEYQMKGNFSVGYNNGISALYFNANNSGIYFCSLQPVKYDSYYLRKPFANIPDTDVTAFQIDSQENIFVQNGNRRIDIYGKDSDYRQYDTLYEAPEGLILKDIRLCNDEKSLFVLFEAEKGKSEKSFGVLDLKTGKMDLYDSECTVYAFFLNENKALICSDHMYCLISFDDGLTVWTKSYPESDAENSGDIIRGAAVSPDGSAGFLRIRNSFATKVSIISMTDGSLVKEITLGSGMSAGPVVSRDGIQLAVSLSNSLLFFSLPDMQLSSCPVDMNVLKDGEKGVEITGKDPVTGEEYQYALPCGAAIPDGSVCTCNCVAGRGGCSCVGYSDSGGSSGGSHYWHPN